MGCSAEQAYNQTMFLLQPFDAMMSQLNWTIGGLQDAATNIGRGLKPLEDGLGTVEMYLDNGKLQLYGTRKVRSASMRTIRIIFGIHVMVRARSENSMFDFSSKFSQWAYLMVACVGPLD